MNFEFFSSSDWNLFYRISSKNGEEWKAAIEKHQKFQYGKNVCIRHFLESDYTKQGDKLLLKSNAIPSIFDEIESIDQYKLVEIDYSDEIVDGANLLKTDETCSHCPFLLQKIKDLEHDILVLKSEYNVMTAKIEQQKKQLKEGNVQKSKQLNVSQNEVSRLKKILDHLKNENYIPDTEKDLLNVMNFSNTRLMLFSFINRSIIELST